MKGWSETDMEYRQRLVDEAWGDYERLGGRDRLAGQPCRYRNPDGSPLSADWKMNLSHEHPLSNDK